MRTAENRRRYDRSKLRYPSDVTDAEWLVLKPHIPRAKRGGNRRHVDEREIVNDLMYILTTGSRWRAIPKDLPARPRLYNYFDLWSWDPTLERMHHALYAQYRKDAEREASPSAAIISNQSVKSAEKGGNRTHPAMLLACRSRARSSIFSSIPRALDACSRAWC
jgi:transposase